MPWRERLTRMFLWVLERVAARVAEGAAVRCAVPVDTGEYSFPGPGASLVCSFGGLVAGGKTTTRVGMVGFACSIGRSRLRTLRLRVDELSAFRSAGAERPSCRLHRTLRRGVSLSRGRASSPIGCFGGRNDDQGVPRRCNRNRQPHLSLTLKGLSWVEVSRP
jgi:hypothetical protein